MIHLIFVFYCFIGHDIYEIKFKVCALYSSVGGVNGFYNHLKETNINITKKFLKRTIWLKKKLENSMKNRKSNQIHPLQKSASRKMYRGVKKGRKKVICTVPTQSSVGEQAKHWPCTCPSHTHTHTRNSGCPSSSHLVWVIPRLLNTICGMSQARAISTMPDLLAPMLHFPHTATALSSPFPSGDNGFRLRGYLIQRFSWAWCFVGVSLRH